MVHRIVLTARSVIASLAVAAMVISTQGCAKQSAVEVVSNINIHIPAVVAAADTAAAVIAGLVPTDAALVEIASAAFDGTAKTLQALTASYLASPNASTLAQIQAAVTTLEAQIDTATLQTVGIKNVTTQAAVLAALKGLLTVATVIFALISPTLSPTQVSALRGHVQLTKTRKYMDEAELRAELQGVNVDAAFGYAAAHGI